LKNKKCWPEKRLIKTEATGNQLVLLMAKSVLAMMQWVNKVERRVRLIAEEKVKE
jgi:hypothetical protein